MSARFYALMLLALVHAGPASARPLAIPPGDQRDVAVTVYNGNLGLVRDVREARLPGRQVEVQFEQVATQIDPTSVHLRSLTDPAGLAILEQNYEYDLLSSQKLLEKYVGRKVRLYDGGGTYHEATLLTTNGPVFEIDGQIHLGSWGRLVLPALPENLVATPTLNWLLRSRSDRPQRMEVSYLTGGITWTADYVLVLGAADERADLTGWVTIDNRSGATYPDATLKLVAGDVHRAEDPRRASRVLELAAKAGPDTRPDLASEGFFEYHLYTVAGRTTIKDNQQKQLALLSATDVPVRKRLIYYGAQEYYRNSYGVPIGNQKVGVYLDIRNSRADHLGLPLPKGRVRVYKADSSGSQEFVGEDWIDHTPEAERVEVKMGTAFDIVGERTQRDWRRIADRVWEVEWELVLRNHKKADQVVSVIEPVPGDWQVLSSTHPYDQVESHTLRWELTVPREGATKLVYRLRTRF
jgi:hypothetical protein